MSEEMRTFGYLCPKCGKTVMAARSIFALEAADAEIICDCGESVLQTEFDGEKYKVYVPCGICGETHMAVCPPERVLKGATALGCAKTKQFCCFIGDEGTVEKNLRELVILAEKEKQQKFLKRLATEYVIMGKECERAEMKEAAITNYQKALTLYPGHPEAKRRLKHLKE